MRKEAARGAAAGVWSWSLPAAALLAAQRAAIETCRPGMTQNDVETAARRVLEARSAEIGIVAHCPHHITHWIGLDTHDVGARTTRFERNMTLAVEPGLYIKAWGVGIRIEDTVRVDDKPEVLTTVTDLATVRAHCIRALLQSNELHRTCAP